MIFVSKACLGAYIERIDGLSSMNQLLLFHTKEIQVQIAADSNLNDQQVMGHEAEKLHSL